MITDDHREGRKHKERRLRKPCATYEAEPEKNPTAYNQFQPSAQQQIRKKPKN